MSQRFDRETLIGRLEPVKYDEQAQDEQARLEQMSLAGVLLTLAEINHEREYDLCRRAAQHLLGELREPEDIEVE
ncbi:MAG: hypothetical protein ACKV2Q_33265 [Planctomycetaceae bacterium]